MKKSARFLPQLPPWSAKPAMCSCRSAAMQSASLVNGPGSVRFVERGDPRVDPVPQAIQQVPFHVGRSCTGPISRCGSGSWRSASCASPRRGSARTSSNGCSGSSTRRHGTSATGSARRWATTRSPVPRCSGSSKVDETMIGGKAKGENWRDNKHWVAGAVERGGRSGWNGSPTSRKRPSTTFVRRTVQDEAEATYTDELASHMGLETDTRRHESVNHSKEEWVVGNVHTNSVEGVWSPSSGPSSVPSTRCPSSTWTGIWRNWSGGSTTGTTPTSSRTRSGGSWKPRRWSTGGSIA